jgi:uncharacterized membrane protein YbjE (DUF340 family)
MDKRVLEVLNHILTILVYSFLLFKNIKSQCFSTSDNIISLITIIFSVSIMFYNWSIKE